MKTENEILETRIVTARCLRVDPQSIDSYLGMGGYSALQKALGLKTADLIDEIRLSGLKGRGGAGFPCHTKLDAVRMAEADTKYMVCNADEGEPGNFKDKYLLENDPHQLLEGMIIEAYIAGCTTGYIYIRGEYDAARTLIKRAIVQARERGYLGKNISGSNFCFDIQVKTGAGSYICGEEFALIESIEGKAGRPRNKPPYPTLSGINNMPTVIGNVETISNIPFIINNGHAAYSSIGTASSSGTRLVSLSGNIRRPGVYEVPFGTSIREIVEILGQGVPEDRDIQMVQLGGASGPCIPPDMMDLKLDYAEFADAELSMGSCAVIVIDNRYPVLDAVRLITRFFKHESCGKCTPCREGIRQML
ncbi:MAG: NADH-ubiquinone oxidoreductase-F iron-sulfur binding region domain-containing protein, partial [Bacillota bacterium]|nr:NADH-ubiquinone oxidoreductase-F iron-sulfur binding region domain-containing protein [Bacillota bacterium]